MAKPQHLTALNDNWKVFCAIFAGTFDMDKACDMSGLRRGTVGRYKDDPLIRAQIAGHIKKSCEQAEVDAAILKRHLADMMFADVLDLYDEYGNFKFLSEWPQVWRQSVTSMELYPSGRPFKVKFVDRMKVIELLGKHVDVNAFEDRHRHVHELSEELVKRIGAARQRAGLPVTVEGEVVSE